MTEKNTGGPAFPRIEKIQDPNTIDHSRPAFSKVVSSDGMTLRDWLAGQALAGKMSIDSIEYLTPQDIAERCYRQADAMLAARGDDQ